jgi:hypothetical protein
MPKKPVTPFTRYSRPAILAVFLVEFIPSLLSHANDIVRRHSLRQAAIPTCDFYLRSG